MGSIRRTLSIKPIATWTTPGHCCWPKQRLCCRQVDCSAHPSKKERSLCLNPEGHALPSLCSSQATLSEIDVQVFIAQRAVRISSSKGHALPPLCSPQATLSETDVQVFIVQGCKDKRPKGAYFRHATSWKRTNSMSNGARWHGLRRFFFFWSCSTKSNQQVGEFDPELCF